MSMRLIFSSLVLLLAQSAWALSVVSQWAMPTRFNHPWELRPYERTKPLVVGDLVYTANLDGLVQAVHRTQGYVLWKKKLEGGVDGAFVYGRSKIFVGDTKGNLYALYTRDGSEAWRFKVAAEWLAPPLVVKDKVFAATSNDELYALTENTGKEVWHYSHRGDEKMTIRGTSGPASNGSEVAQGFSDGYVASLNIADGKLKWSRRLRVRERFYDVDATPYIDDKRVIAATFDGKLYSLDRNTGDIQWSRAVGSYGGFHVSEDKLYFAGLDSNLYALNLASGEEVWKKALNRGVGLAPVMAGKHLVVTTSNDPVYVVDPKDGKIVWQGSLGAGTLTGASGSAEGWFFCQSNYGNVYSFEIRPDLNERRLPSTIAAPRAL